jgi:hypothetical protein
MFQQAISYVSPTTSLAYNCTLKAAALVPDGDGVSCLPPPIGTLQVQQITDLGRYGIGPHWAAARHPDLVVRHYHVLVENRFLVSRNEVSGVALYEDNRGSAPCHSLVSVNGRNANAPLTFNSSDPESPLWPGAQLRFETREFEYGGQLYQWDTTRVHGYRGPTGREFTDWKDGIPTKLEGMYTPKGEVSQYIWVPNDTPGIGVAEQQLARSTSPTRSRLRCGSRSRRMWSWSNGRSVHRGIGTKTLNV